MKKNIHLLIIDPQNDFCDLPADWCATDPLTGTPAAPALPVSGAHADMLRLAALIREAAGGITGMTVTLDSHHRFHIAHPTFWKTGAGGAVAPFTPITSVAVRSGDFFPRDASLLPQALAYLDALEQRGRYILMVWPVHCEMGSWGHNIHPAIKGACNTWEDSRLAVVQKISKGSNPFTEHYSALQAEVPDAKDPGTQLNKVLLASLASPDLLVIAGEASSHCVRATTEHILESLPDSQPGKMVLLTDCMSPVRGFEAQHAALLEAMASRGVALCTSIEMRVTLRQNG